jgi:hypothetical protein
MVHNLWVSFCEEKSHPDRQVAGKGFSLLDGNIISAVVSPKTNAAVEKICLSVSGFLSGQEFFEWDRPTRGLCLQNFVGGDGGGNSGCSC